MMDPATGPKMEALSGSGSTFIRVPRELDVESLGDEARVYGSRYAGGTTILPIKVAPILPAPILPAPERAPRPRSDRPWTPYRWPWMLRYDESEPAKP